MSEALPATSNSSKPSKTRNMKSTTKCAVGIGCPFDPAAFDLDEVNERLAEFKL